LFHLLWAPALLAPHQLPFAGRPELWGETRAKASAKLAVPKSDEAQPFARLGPTSSAAGSGGGWLLRPRLEEGSR